MVKVKICGITNVEDALAAIECGADAVGFVFVDSPRQVSPEAVRSIVAKLPPFVTTVGVFADNELSQVKGIVSYCGLDVVQLHGSEGPDFCEALFPKVIKTFTPKRIPPLEALKLYPAPTFLIDQEKGSTAQPVVVWGIARDLARHRRIMLAGGLTPENVAQAIRLARPYAVDVASGVEKMPGKKDLLKMKAFIRTAKM